MPEEYMEIDQLLTSPMLYCTEEGCTVLPVGMSTEEGKVLSDSLPNLLFFPDR